MLFVVAVALIDLDGRVLLAQRPEGKAMAGLWEFPGGKVHADETPEDALSRELKEELGIRTCRNCFSPAAFVTWPLNGSNGQPDGERDRRPEPKAKDLHPLHEVLRYAQDDERTQGCDPSLQLDPDDPDQQMLMLLYLCRRWVGTPQPHEGQALKWVYPKEMKDYPMPPADKPLLHRLLEML